MADDPGALGVVGRLGLADGPDDDAVHDRPHLLLALDGGQVGRGQGGEHRRHQLGLAAHGPQGPLEDVEDPLGRRGAPGRHLGQAGVELLHPVDQGGRQEVVLGGEVAVDGAHGHVGPGGHVAHLHGLVAALEAELHGGVDHPLAPCFLSPGQGPGSTLCCTASPRYSRPCRNGTRSTLGARTSDRARI